MGAVAAWAFVALTALADTSAIRDGVGGWTKITAIPADPSLYYFVFADHSQDLMLELRSGVHNTNKAMFYMTSQNPLADRSFLWTLEANSGTYAGMYTMRNVEYAVLVMQTEWNAAYRWDTNDQAAPCEWSAVNMQYDSGNGYWTFENGKYPMSSTATYKGYLGPWEEERTNTNLVTGLELAGNKSGDYIGHFQIYAILKTQADQEGTDYTGRITNAGFETGDLTGWTVTNANDTGVKSTSDNTYKTVGSTGGYLFNHWWTGTPLTQNVGVLPAGVYQLSADVATGNSETSLGTLYLNANEARSTGYVSSNNAVFGTEHLVFRSDGSTATTIGLRGGEDASVSASDAIVKGAWRESGYWWFKADNFRLWKIGETQEELAAWLQTLVALNTPYADVDDITDYTTRFNTYKTYDSSNTVDELVEAINYLTNEYDDYCWNNASTAHPVDVTAMVISGADCTSNDAWPGNGRTTATGTYYDGTSRTYFTQNHESGPSRSQDVTVRYEGAYLLRTIVRPVAAASYATIALGSESTTTRGIPTGTDNIGNGWTYNDVYYAQNAINQGKSISISLSNTNSSREADCGEMHLYYIGRNTDLVQGLVRRYLGIYGTAPAIELTDEVPVADVTEAAFSAGSSAVTFTNPNGLVFVREDAQTSATQNEVVGTTCANLVLADGHPFANPTAFTATSATYAVSALAGGLYATLMLPFEATTLAGTAYVLDQDINLIDGNLRGTPTATIAANAPVLVTATGSYSGSGVSVPVVAQGATYTNGQLVGTYQDLAAPAASYVLQNHTGGEGVAFYLVGAVKPTVAPFRAYIKPQSQEAKALRVLFDDEATGIETTAAVSLDDAACYSASGIRLTAPARGLNIVRTKDGQALKVFVK